MVQTRKLRAPDGVYTGVPNTRINSLGPLVRMDSMTSRPTLWPQFQSMGAKGQHLLRRYDVGGSWAKEGYHWSALSHKEIQQRYVNNRGWHSDIFGVTFTPFNLASNLEILNALGLNGARPDFLKRPTFWTDLLVPYGSKGIAASIPFDSVAELGTALGEIALGGLNELPQIPMRTLRKALSAPKQARLKDVLRNQSSKAGSEYLNVVFAWNPTIGDVRDSLYAMKNAKTLIETFLKRFEKTYHFRKTLQYETSSYNTTISRVPVDPPLPSGYFSTPLGTCHLSGTLKQRRWASGEFQFHQLSSHEDGWRQELTQKVAIADYLLGIRPDAEMAWELTPFSWLVDWVSNVGSFMKNVSYIGRDGLVLRYCYAMHSWEAEIRVVNSVGIAQSPRLGPISGTWNSNAKLRIRATPYGFGLTLDSFTPKQWAILAALGQTLAHGKLF